MIFPHLILIDQFQISGYLNCFMKFNHPSSLNTRRSIIKYVSTLIKGNILHMFIYLMQSNSIKQISHFFNYCFFVIWHHYKESICPCFDLMIDVFRRIGSISAILRWRLILKSEQFWFFLNSLWRHTRIDSSSNSLIMTNGFVSLVTAFSIYMLSNGQNAIL